MSIKIGRYTADGPFSSTTYLNDGSGVYIILGRNTEDEGWNIVDVGESCEVKSRVEGHDRVSCWNEQGYTIIGCAVIYVDELTRMKIESELRNQYSIPCGQR